MNQIWNRADIEAVRDALKVNSAFLYKDIFFFQTSEDSPDVLLQYLHTIAVPAGGACAAALVRKVIETANVDHPAQMSQFFLEHSKDDGKLVPAVVITSKILQDKHDDKSLAIIAHEIGHIMAGDILPENAVEKYTDAHLTNELAADSFAVAVLGDNAQVVTLMSHVYARASSPEAVASVLDYEGAMQEYEISVSHLKARLENVQ